MPLWASEGLAEFYSSFAVASGGKALELGRPLADHVSTLRNGQAIPMATLLAVDHGSPYYNEGTKQGMFYAKSWALVHYLMAGKDGQRRPQFSKYITLLGSGQSIDESVREAFHTDSAGLERELADYVRNRMVWPYYTVKLEEKLDVDKETQTTTLSEAQTDYYLGDLLLHMRRYDVAEKQLQMAISLDSRLAGPQASMGILRMRQDRDEDALPFLSKAVQSDSQNHMAHYYYALLLQQLAGDEGAQDRKERLELMRTHLKKSIEIAPRFVEPYSLLGYVALALQDELDDTETTLTKALRIAPGREALRLTLGQVMTSNNKALAARTLLTELRASTSDSTIRSRADDLLKRIAGRLESERAMRDYDEKRKVAGPGDTSAQPSAQTADREPPTLPRTDVPPARSGTDTAIRRPKRVEGPQVEGLLMALDCARGLTLEVRLGNGVVRLHTETPSNIDFVRYVSTVKDSIACGPVKPEPNVVITYRPVSDPAFLGEPLVVEFR